MVRDKAPRLPDGGEEKQGDRQGPDELGDFQSGGIITVNVKTRKNIFVPVMSGIGLDSAE